MHVRSGDDAPVTVDLSFSRKLGPGEGGGVAQLVSTMITILLRVVAVEIFACT